MIRAFLKFIAELKRRKVFQVGSIYLVTAWGASLGAAELFPAFGIPDWGVRAFVITAALGFPLALILAWAFEITPDGVTLDPGANPVPPEVPVEEGTTTTWAAPATRVRVAWLDAGREVSKEFNGPFVIGRDPEADVRLRQSKISRLHARVIYENERWRIVDLNSRNGTKLNGHRVDGSCDLEERNEVRLYDGDDPIRINVIRTEEETQIA